MKGEGKNHGLCKNCQPGDRALRWKGKYPLRGALCHTAASAAEEQRSAERGGHQRCGGGQGRVSDTVPVPDHFWSGPCESDLRRGAKAAGNRAREPGGRTGGEGERGAAVYQDAQRHFCPHHPGHCGGRSADGIEQPADLPVNRRAIPD